MTRGETGKSHVCSIHGKALPPCRRVRRSQQVTGRWDAAGTAWVTALVYSTPCGVRPSFYAAAEMTKMMVDEWVTSMRKHSVEKSIESAKTRRDAGTAKLNDNGRRWVAALKGMGILDPMSAFVHVLEEVTGKVGVAEHEKYDLAFKVASGLHPDHPVTGPSKDRLAEQVIVYTA